MNDRQKFLENIAYDAIRSSYHFYVNVTQEMVNAFVVKNWYRPENPSDGDLWFEPDKTEVFVHGKWMKGVTE